MPLDIESLRNYCIGKEDVTEEFPFGPDTLVFKVNGRIFFLASLDEKPLCFNVKCHPDHAAELREKYEDVQPGYHMNKKHWNTVNAEGRVPTEELLCMIDQSYHLVSKNISQKKNKRRKS